MNYNTGYGTGTSYANLLSQLQANPAQQQVLPGWRHVPGVGTLPSAGGQQMPQMPPPQMPPPMMPPPSTGGGGVPNYGGGGGGSFIHTAMQGQKMPFMGPPQGGVIPPTGRPSIGSQFSDFLPGRQAMFGMGMNMMRGGLGI